MELTHISLFSGIGGIDLAAEWAGFETICFVENNAYCQKVLRKHWPNTPIIEDVKDVAREKIMAYANSAGLSNRSKEHRGKQASSGEGFGGIGGQNTFSRDRTTLLSGGFPCQPHSVAGKREGSADDHNLWPEFRRVIGEIKPRWVLAENVPGIFSSDAGRFFGTILADLAEMGYSAGWATYGAVDVGALHRRNRVFIVAYSPERQDNGRERGNLEGETGEGRCIDSAINPSRQDVADTTDQGLEGTEPERTTPATGLSTQRGAISDTAIRGGQPGSTQCYVGGFQDEALRSIWDKDYWAVEPNVGRVAYGIPSRVDRLKCLGNAVVPQQIYPILKAIAEIERNIKYS